MPHLSGSSQRQRQNSSHTVGRLDSSDLIIEKSDRTLKLLESKFQRYQRLAPHRNPISATAEEVGACSYQDARIVQDQIQNAPKR